MQEKQNVSSNTVSTTDPEEPNRLWSEQYLLAAFLLSSSKQLEVLLACAYLASKTESRKLLSDTFGTENFGGCSFWLRII